MCGLLHLSFIYIILHNKKAMMLEHNVQPYVDPTGRPYPEVAGLAITLMFDTLFAWLNARHASAHWVCLVPNIHGLMNKYMAHMHIRSTYI